ncbi:hypothetical protein GDO81_015553 [Engystomops pustulosus]|uniref:Uncharacterized protein n=1 Tax=Engystomops pustulosus TaxID=76066 RepID=A0AAV7AT58_ENGPU|nr:hypothetical protein GDO81_015553 [Engystomops pustulosus]
MPHKQMLLFTQFRSLTVAENKEDETSLQRANRYGYTLTPYNVLCNDRPLLICLMKGLMVFTKLMILHYWILVCERLAGRSQQTQRYIDDRQ